jgi:hypothetical protein
VNSNPVHCEVYSIQHYGDFFILFIMDSLDFHPKAKFQTSWQFLEVSICPPITKLRLPYSCTSSSHVPESWDKQKNWMLSFWMCQSKYSNKKLSMFYFELYIQGSPHLVKTGQYDSFCWLKGEVRKNVGDFQKACRALNV